MNYKTMNKMYFSKEIAKDLMKVDEAIFLHHICWWVEVNKLKESNYEEGEYWTYNSDTKLAKQFGYFTPSTIRRMRKKLLEKGYIKVGCFNHWKQDKTTWYTYTDLVEFVAGPEYLEDIRYSLDQKFTWKGENNS